MPKIEEGVENVPDRAHLGLMTKNGTYIPIPPGAYMAIIEDPQRADKILPLVLTKVSLTKLDFACACGSPKCTRKIRYRAEKSGSHPPREAMRPTAFSQRDEE